jgi:CheY-like chemotaxis protein
MAEAKVPELILMDIQLPGMDGYEVTRRIKANPVLRHIPIIAVTSYALSGDDQKVLEAGCDAYVTKPFDPAELLAKPRVRALAPRVNSKPEIRNANIQNSNFAAATTPIYSNF